LVVEAIPSALTDAIMPALAIPVIGIGAGPGTDGQVLVFHDLLGIREGAGARFVRRYANLQDAMTAGVRAYADDVRSRGFPAPEHTYRMPADELATVVAQLAART
jgi:3-methyl-2-oxobutanoate hydroxymethyltransferase